MRTFHKNKKVKPVKSVQANIFQSDTFRKDFGRLHFVDEPNAHEMQHVHEQESCIPISVANLIYQSSNCEN